MRCFTDDVISVRNLPMRRDAIVKGDNRVKVSIIATRDNYYTIIQKDDISSEELCIFHVLQTILC